MKLQHHEYIQWLTTPQQLRQLADLMESMEYGLYGREDRTALFVEGQPCDLHVVRDEEAMRREKEGE